MKGLAIILSVIVLMISAEAQVNVDSAKQLLALKNDDLSRYEICRLIYEHYEETNKDSALFYAQQCLLLARKNGKVLNEIHSLDNKAYQLIALGRYAEGLQYLFEAFRLAENVKNDKASSWPFNASSFSKDYKGNKRLLMLAYTHHIFGILFWNTDDNEQAIIQFGKARTIAASIGYEIRQMMASMNLGRSYMVAGELQKALDLEKEAERLAVRTGFTKYLGQVYNVLANIYGKLGDKKEQIRYNYLSIETAIRENNLNNLNTNYFTITKFFLENRQYDSSLHYAMKGLEVSRSLGRLNGVNVNLGTVYENVYLCYMPYGPPDSLFKYQQLTLMVKDSLYKLRIKNLTDFQKAGLREQLRLRDVEKQKVLYQARIRTYLLLAGIAILSLLAVVFFWSNRQKQKARLRIEQAYNELKTTQAQLVQSEKMASLGELTAGIAHEIQNPLNFVNNFSELTKELTTELNEELDKNDISAAKQVARDIAGNAEKIVHHGKRADAIVKSMLQHSRANSGKKEPTDINALADEYLRLSYHGLRAKDKSFNAEMRTSFDSTIPMIEVVPQDIGRVLLNLINNAFNAVNEKQKIVNNGYVPLIEVGTKKQGDKIFIHVKDNGNGIPEKVLNKIWQPFFTTKPTGEGTGLGLSLSYDIITKGHGGDMKVETKEGEGTEFIIQLPAI